MGLEELIFPLLIIGSIIVQWLTSRNENKRKEDSRSRPSQSPGRGELPNGQPQDPLAELMEALGQSPQSPPPPVPVEPEQTGPEPAGQRPVSPPSLPTTPGRTFLDHLEAREKEVRQKKEEARSILQNSGTKNSRGKQPVRLTPPHSEGMRSARLRQALVNKNQIREAILLNEILQKPVSLR